MRPRLGIEHELRQGTVQARDSALHHCEARPGKLYTHVEIEPQRLTQIDMVLGSKIESLRRTPATHLYIARFIRTYRNAHVRQVRDSHQHGLQFGLNLLQAIRGAIQLVLDRTDLGLRSLGGFSLPLAHEHANLLRQLVALGLQLLRSRLNGLAL